MKFLRTLLTTLQEGVEALRSIAAALDRLVIVQMALARSEGVYVSLETGNEEGELLLPDGVTERDVFTRVAAGAERDREIAIREWQERTFHIGGPGSYGGSWVGPEGAEDTADQLEATWLDREQVAYSVKGSENPSVK